MACSCDHGSWMDEMCAGFDRLGCWLGFLVPLCQAMVDWLMTAYGFDGSRLSCCCGRNRELRDGLATLLAFYFLDMFLKSVDLSVDLLCKLWNWKIIANWLICPAEGLSSVYGSFIDWYLSEWTDLSINEQIDWLIEWLFDFSAEWLFPWSIEWRI